MVQLVKFAVPTLVRPPPFPLAESLLNVQLAMISVPRLSTPPPRSAVPPPPVIVKPQTVAVALCAATLKYPAPPAAADGHADRWTPAVIVWRRSYWLRCASWPELKLIVWPVLKSEGSKVIVPPPGRTLARLTAAGRLSLPNAVEAPPAVVFTARACGPA